MAVNTSKVKAEALPREQALMAMFEEWGKTPMTTEALRLRDELLGVVSGADHEALDKYTVLLCKEAFVGGFLTALEVLRTDGLERNSKGDTVALSLHRPCL